MARLVTIAGNDMAFKCLLLFFKIPQRLKYFYRYKYFYSVYKVRMYKNKKLL